MGGIIACEIAIRYAQRVEGLVLIGPVVPSPVLTEVFGKRIETVRKGMRVLLFWDWSLNQVTDYTRWT